MAKSLGKTKMASVKCKYCEKEFKREKTLITHTCEQKRRHLNRNDRGVRIGLETYLKFYKFSQSSSKIKTYDDFVKSPYYSAFVKYGNYCINTKVVSIPRYTDFLIKGSKPLDKWCSDIMYTSFLEKFIRIEPVGDALTRTIEYSLEWAKEKDMVAHDMLRYGGTNRICHDIIAGRISPWVIYQSASGREFLEGSAVGQLDSIWDVIDPSIWTKIFDKHRDDVDFAKNVLSIGGW